MTNKREDFRIEMPLEHKICLLSGALIYASNSRDSKVNLSMGGFAIDVPMNVELEFDKDYELYLFIASDSSKPSPQTVRQQRESKSNKRQLVIPFKLLREQKNSSRSKRVVGRFPVLSGVEGNRLLQFIQLNYAMKV